MALSFRNLPQAHVLEVGELNAYDVLCSDVVVFTKATLPVAEPMGKVARRAAHAADDGTDGPEARGHDPHGHDVRRRGGGRARGAVRIRQPRAPRGRLDA